MTAKLTMCRGISGSGKSTWALEQVREGNGTVARLNRDSLRAMMHDGQFIPGVTEDQIIVAEQRAAAALLAHGVHVIIDDTNLTSKHEKLWRSIASGVEFEVRDFDVDLNEAIARDSCREGSARVGSEVIRRQHQQLKSSRKARQRADRQHDAEELPAVPRLYTPTEGAPVAIMCDLDGTLCIHNGRDPFDLSRVEEDLPNRSVIHTIEHFARTGHQIIFCSGRNERAREGSLRWIAKHVDLGGQTPLAYFRADDDYRKDSVVKLEIFDAHIRDAFDVVFVLDDRQQVVDAWRSIGLDVFQVAPGDF